jgi:UDP-N-acetylmuramate dehydrogenase
LNIEAKLLNLLDKNSIKINEPMKKHTTFRVGGNASLFLIPKNYEELKAAVSVCNEFNKKFYLIGNGSNTIVKDSGFDGVIINTCGLNKIEIEGNKITAQCGVILPVLAQHALRSSLTGVEFLSGIPGTVGGAVCMNAGAYGREICSVIESVKVLDSFGNIVDLKNDDIHFSYRHTDLQEKNIIVVEATFRLNNGNQDEILTYMNTLKQKRQTTQPLEYPNAGSIFKKCGDYAAGYLIDQIGLKGFRIGGAEISEKHANFIVNKNNASAEDITALIEYIKEQVYKSYKLVLETEVIII